MRTLFHLMVGDVVIEGRRDWLVEGVLVLEGGERPLRLSRLVDGREERWLATDGKELILLRAWTGTPPALPPTQSLVLGDAVLTLAAKGGGAVIRAGDCGSRSAERCRYWLYRGLDQERAWVDDFSGSTPLCGEAVPESLLDFLPGS